MAASAGGTTGTLEGHVWHAVIGIGITFLALGGMWAGERITDRRRRGTPRPAASPVAGTASGASLALVPVVGVALLGAASVHVVVLPAHLREAGIYGLFFGVTVVTQLMAAALVLARPTRVLLAAGLAGNLALVVLWLVTRTIAIPLGPAAGETEAVGGLDVLATLFELIAIVGSAALLRERIVQRASHPRQWARPIKLAIPLAVSAVAAAAILGGTS